MLKEEVFESGGSEFRVENAVKRVEGHFSAMV